MKNKELRSYEGSITIETREDEPAKIVGHAAVFNTISENLGWFREIIRPGAFDGVLENDVRALFNHDSNKVLGRTKSGTLTLEVDEKGLRYVINPPDTTIAKDLMKSIERGDINQSSFGFIVEKDEWEEQENGEDLRIIHKVKRLFDVSPVTFPAYPDTDVAKRSHDQFAEEHKEEVKDEFDYELHKNKVNQILTIKSKER
jgi:uncharacterized protein